MKMAIRRNADQPIKKWWGIQQKGIWFELKCQKIKVLGNCNFSNRSSTNYFDIFRLFYPIVPFTDTCAIWVKTHLITYVGWANSYYSWLLSQATGFRNVCLFLCEMRIIGTLDFMADFLSLHKYLNMCFFFNSEAR